MVGKGHAEERRYGVWMFFGRRLSLTSVVPDGVRLAVGYSSPFQNGKVLPILRFHVPQRRGRPMSKPKPTFYSLATKTQPNPNCTFCISPTTPPWNITRNLSTAPRSIPPIFESAPHPLSYIYTSTLETQIRTTSQA